MKNIKTFENFFDFAKIKKSEVVDEFTDVKDVRQIKYVVKDTDNIFCVFTRELNNKNKEPFSRDHYQFTFTSKERLRELKEKYPIGGKYNGETITSVGTLKGKHKGKK